MGDFKPMDLASTAWAFATLGQVDAQLFTAVVGSPANLGWSDTLLLAAIVTEAT